MSISAQLTTLLAPFCPRGITLHRLPDAPTAVSYLVLPSQTARACWELLHQHRAALGILPVIVDESSAEEYALVAHEPAPPQHATVTAEGPPASESIAAKAWLDAAFAEHRDSFDDGDGDDWRGDQGELPGITTPDQTAPYVRLALVAAAHTWALPMALGFGGANACPEPYVHSALWRYWDAHYGIHAVSIAPDSLELRIERPPQTRQAARALAREHAGYNPDKVWQDAGSLERLAAQLHKRSRWLFWWD